INGIDGNTRVSTRSKAAIRHLANKGGANEQTGHGPVLPYPIWCISMKKAVNISNGNRAGQPQWPHHCRSQGTPSPSPSILVFGQCRKNQVASTQEVIWEQSSRPSH